MEAAFLFHKYDKDGDNMLDMVERRKMREDLKLGVGRKTRLNASILAAIKFIAL